MVGTYLNRGFKSNHNLDSIESQKNKLIFIIDEIKKYSSVELSLVGHSQGGLVNLEATIERSFSIKRVISISTPYAPVYLGEKLIFLDFFFQIGGESAYNLFCNDSKNIPAYKASVEKLCSSSYYSDLKNRWNNLSIKPPLTVITGTAGHLSIYIPGISNPNYYNPDTLNKYPFDCLVRFYEQTNIQNARFIHLVDKNIPCYEEKGFAKATCYYQHGIYMSCKKTCNLSSISFTGTVIDALFDLISNAINGRNIHDFANYKVAVAIYAGLYRRPQNVPAGYMDYYNIFSNDYNHNYIRYNHETISHLLALLN